MPCYDSNTDQTTGQGLKMAYIRKTRDEWEIQGNYGQGWECVNTEATLEDARRSAKEYRANERYPFKLVKKRVKI